MNDEQYRDYSHQLLQDFVADVRQRARALPAEHELLQLVDALAEPDLDLYSRGSELVGRLFSQFPDFAPLFPRQLLWFIGGDCLHFMPDEEIEQFQALEQLREDAAARGETLDLGDARAKLLKLQ